MTPSLPVALAILTFLSTPAVAAPDFAVMRECGPKHYERYQKAGGFEKGDPAALAQKLELINEVLDSAGSYADSISRPGSDAPALPPGCALNEAKIKDEVYGGLADLRRKINDKAADALPEEEKEPTRVLTAIEGELDGAMGEAKNFAELKLKIRGIVGKVTAAEGEAPETVKPRVLRLKKRIGAILVRISEKQSAGASSFDQAIPAEVLSREAKRVAEAKKRTGGFKGDAFGDKTDDLSGPQTAGDHNEGNRAGAITAEIQGSGADDPGALTDAAAGGRGTAITPIAKKPGSRAKPAIETAKADEDTDPDEGPSVLAEAVKDSAMSPLGGAVNPPAPNEAENYDTRKEAIKAKTLRLRKGRGMENDEEDLAFRSKLPFTMVATVRNGNGVVTLVSPSGTPLKRVQIVNGKPVVKPGELTAVEAGFIEGELE